MRLVTNTFLLSVLVVLSHAIPRTKRDAYLSQNYLARASQILGTNLLKDNIDIDGNHVHSPLGISTVLAILAEGSRGATYDEFTSALGFPADKADLRSAAKEILQNFNSKDVSTTPAFKTWFYIYKNNTINEEYKQIVRDYYLAEVKDIDRSEYDWNEPHIDESMNDNSKDIIGFETLKKSENFDDLQATKSYNVPDDIEEKKEASKFDKVVEDKQYVEVPVIKEEIAKEQLEKEIEKKDDKNNNDAQHLIDVKEGEVNDEDNETIRDAEKKEELKKDSESTKPVEASEPERISIPLKKLDELEIMQTVESEFPSSRLSRAQTLLMKDDITSALSANSIVGNDEEHLTKILLFNGLHFRGSWKTPFQELRDGIDVFYVNKEESLPVTMMRTYGEFRTAKLDELDSEAIEFSYDDKNHSLLIIIPNEKEGLRNLISKLKTEDIAVLRTRLAPEPLSIGLPKFGIDSTSRSEVTLKNLGLRKLFSSEEADLRGIAEEDKLHVDEIVQHVNIRVDEGACREDALTAGPETRILDEGRTVVADRPFLYFVLHNDSNFVLVLGKIMSPSPVDETTF